MFIIIIIYLLGDYLIKLWVYNELSFFCYNNFCLLSMLIYVDICDLLLVSFGANWDRQVFEQRPGWHPRLSAAQMSACHGRQDAKVHVMSRRCDWLPI